MSKKAYTTLDGQANSLLVINKSKFLGFAVNVSSVAEANTHLEKLRKTHWDASHNCFAYIIGKQNPVMKASDDGEPGGTAGVPMLDVLKKQGLTDILVMVTRYFGGIKLGAGGLVRAYSSCASQTLKQAKIVTYLPCGIYAQGVEYDVWARIAPKIKTAGALLFNTVYTDKVNLTLGILDADLDRVKALFKAALKTDDILTFLKTEYVPKAADEVEK